MNGIDAQHLNTVHKLSVEMDLALSQTANGDVIDFTLSGDLPNNNWRSQLGRRFLGHRYTYAMRYAHGCVGLLTMLKEHPWLPALHMLYAYRPLPSGKTHIQPIYVTRKRKGPVGWIINRLLLLATRLCYYALRGEDGKIYDNIQFEPKSLLSIDAPLVAYMRYVNQLERSHWSTASNIQEPINQEPLSPQTPNSQSLSSQDSISQASTPKTHHASNAMAS